MGRKKKVVLEAVENQVVVENDATVKENQIAEEEAVAKKRRSYMRLANSQIDFLRLAQAKFGAGELVKRKDLEDFQKKIGGDSLIWFFKNEKYRVAHGIYRLPHYTYHKRQKTRLVKAA